MSTPKFPFKRWRLMPSFKPVEVEIVAAEAGYWRRGDLIDSKRKRYAIGELFGTRTKAIEHGRAELAKQQAEIDKRQSKVDAKRAALDKAEVA